uniref:Uncharacterized protein n=1 Tax=Helianthus annuus TaxID=4232 RepID=A0A251U7Q8_HELAN
MSSRCRHVYEEGDEEHSPPLMTMRQGLRIGEPHQHPITLMPEIFGDRSLNPPGTQHH